MDQIGMYVNVQIYNQHDLSKETIVYIEDERKYKIIDHINAFNTFIFQLNIIYFKHDSEDRTFTLMCSLRESCDYLIILRMAIAVERKRKQ